jgi:hypothetical protein
MGRGRVITWAIMFATKTDGIWVVEVWKQGMFLACTVFEDETLAKNYASNAAMRGCQAYWWKLD